jgi:hypothetical protein
MSEANTYKRFPAVRCWIRHLLQGKYSVQNKSLYTIFGELKRVRIIATIREKREFLDNQVSGEESFLDEEEELKSRIEFDLDDGTGLIRATLWREDPDKYKQYMEGDIVDIIGMIRNWKGFTSISPEIISLVKNPNKVLLREAEILKRLKAGDISDIPDISEDQVDVEYDEMTEELDVDSLFASDDDNDMNNSSIQEELIAFIEDYSENGVSFEVLLENFNLSEEELRANLEELERGNKILHSDPQADIWSTW